MAIVSPATSPRRSRKCSNEWRAGPPLTLDHLNALPGPEVRAALERCCGSGAWTRRMSAARPFADREALMSVAEREWWALGEPDWREAFAHHPRIGDAAALSERFPSTAAWAGAEQAGVRNAGGRPGVDLAQGNREYEARFGYIFIVCASGLGADEMLARLEQRMRNDAATEIRVAAGEQMKITRLRLEKLLAEDA
jgi:2-oxo-4-hydroxy-4-carboxy-5-ureidoimidazoline decarboxylase